MRDPYSMSQYDTFKESILTIKMDDVPEFEGEDYDLNDPKQFMKYIYNIKKIVRTSVEYRELINFLRGNMDMNKCSFYENVNNIDTSKIKIHIHHHPFTLEDIVMIVFRKRSFFGESLEDEMVAKEVMFLHYLLYVGLIPLSETVHELVHNNYIFIPVDKVMGNFKQFEQMYGDFMEAEQKDKYERNIEFSNTYIEGTCTILDKKYIYMDLTGVYDLPQLNEVVAMMEDKIQKIKNKEIELVSQEPQLKSIFKKI